MSRAAVLIIGVMMIFSTSSLLAQHGGHGGGGGGRHGAPGAASTADSSLVDFNHALAVQATPDQTSHFPGLTKSTEAARKLAQELAQVSGKADSPTESVKKSAALKSAVEEAQGANQDFVKSFTKSQKAGLKELAKKLEKADSEVAKQWKELERQLGENANGEAIAGSADKLEKALEEFKSQQIGLGTEMGLQSPAA